MFMWLTHTMTVFFTLICDESGNIKMWQNLSVNSSTRLASAQEIIFSFKCFSKIFAFGVAVSCPKTFTWLVDKSRFEGCQKLIKKTL